MTSNAELFRFLQKLVNDMYEDLELPGFPDVVVRLQQTLADDKSSARDIVRLVSSDTALSAKLLQLANSAAFKPGDRNISDLKAKVQDTNKMALIELKVEVKDLTELNQLLVAISRLSDVMLVHRLGGRKTRRRGKPK